MLISLFLGCCANQKKAVTDNFVFRLHYKATKRILFVLSLLIGLPQLFKNPVVCKTENPTDDFPSSYCALHPTFIWLETDGEPVADPLGSTLDLSARSSEEHDKHQLFYTYNGFIWAALFIQALIIYLPRHMWYEHEEAIARRLYVDELKSDKIDQIEPAEREGFAKDVVKFLLMKPKLISEYSLHVLFEIGNLLIVIGQLVLMNRYLNGHFYSYGFYGYGFNYLAHLLNMSNANPMESIFPLVTRCVIPHHLYSIGNNTLNADQLDDEEYSCVMTHNYHNRVYFLFLWFWFSMLILAGLLNLAYRLACISRSFRSNWFRNLNSQLSLILDRLSISQLYILRVLEDNLPEVFTQQVLDELKQQLKEQQAINLVQLRKNSNEQLFNG